MNDKERILMEIIRELYSTSLLGPIRGWNSAAYKDEHGGYRVHFAPWVKTNQLKPGDLVMCQTGGVHDFTVGFVRQVVASDHCIIREIGSNRFCDVSNESFVPIIGMTKTDLLEMDEYEFYKKALAAFRRGDEMWYRFGGVEFDGREAIIWIRERYGGITYKYGSKPFAVRMRWNKRTTIKAILLALRDGGYGSRAFEPNDPPDE